MLAELIYSKYLKPEKLSDPHSDFTPDILKKLLETDESEFGWNAYSNLFGPHLPAGTYKEVVFFLPKAFDFLIRNEKDALDLVTPIFGFCSQNVDNLREDGLEQTVKAKILESLNFWTRDFRIEHYDKQMCLNKGWSVDHLDIVLNTESICEGLTDLVRFETLSSLAKEFILSLAFHEGDVTKASWFIEISRARFDVYTPSESPEIHDLLSRESFLNEAYAVLWSETRDYKLTYWQDTFKKIGI